MSEPIAPDSLAALKIKLADAVMEWNENPGRAPWGALVHPRIAALRAHPDYREPGE